MRTIHSRLIWPALLLLLALPIVSHAQVGVGVSITVEPPALPVYEQPEMPADGYLWTPGYWAWGPDGYYWVPGTWVEPPSAGLLWTPGYWGWSNGVYIFNAGYWGPHIGFYGGVNYGYGYGGVGFEGGYWRGGGFYYNRAVMNVGSVHVTNVYEKTVIVNNNTRVSFNGGAGGTAARPTPGELAAAHEHHVEPTPAQVEHVHAASSNHALLASVNHGAPAIAATAKPGAFSGKGVVTAHGASPAPRTDRPATAAHTETHAAPAAHPAEAHAATPAAHPAEAHAATPAAHPAEAHAAARPPTATPRPEVKAAPPHAAAPAAAARPPAPPAAHAAPPPRPKAPPAKEEKQRD
jgi:hypothetical protein